MDHKFGSVYFEFLLFLIFWFFEEKQIDKHKMNDENTAGPRRKTHLGNVSHNNS